MKRFAFVIAVFSLIWGHAASAFAGSPAIAWSVNVDQRLPNSPVALSTPAVLAYGSETRFVLGGRDGWVHVYDSKGSEVKSFALGGRSDSGALALPNGLVVLGDTAGHLYAVDPEQGTIAWQYQLSAAFTSSPVAAGKGFLLQTTDGRIYRFTEKGEKLWSFSGQANFLSMYITSSPVVSGKVVYAALASGDAVALALDSGDLLWKRQLLLSNDSQVLSELKAPMARPLIVKRIELAGEKARNTVLISFYQGEMVGLSIKDGTQKFNLPVSLKSSPLIVDKTLYAADSSGYFYAYDISNGTRLWNKKVSADELVGPVLWNNSIWLADDQGKVYCFSLKGERQGSVDVNGSVARLPMVTKHGLLIRTTRGTMHLVNK